VSANEELIEGGDLDELVRHVDRLCRAEVWDEVVDLRDRARWALERGRQLWPIASLCEYRLALQAPGPWAGAVVVEGAGYLSPGPLAEVAASTHTWADLADAVPAGPLLTVVAHERVVRGEDLRAEATLDAAVSDLPAYLQAWEPAYPLAVYEPDKTAFDGPEPPSADRWGPLTATGAAGAAADEDDVRRALVGIAQTWVSQSNGVARAVDVHGTGAAALAALGVAEARLVPVSASEALAAIAWAGASGGAHGRRRGMAAGRFEAWWVAAALAGLADDWPVPPDELGEAIDELRWYQWDRGQPVSGWHLALVVEDPDNDLSFALEATDQA
jgi:hypothetical protein